MPDETDPRRTVNVKKHLDTIVKATDAISVELRHDTPAMVGLGGEDFVVAYGDGPTAGITARIRYRGSVYEIKVYKGSS